MGTDCLSVGRSSCGYHLRLTGRCTMAESVAAHAFALHALAEDNQTLYVDVTDCQYLDSTFLGSLLSLHRKFGRSESPRLTIIAPPQSIRRLFEPTHLHKLLHFADSSPQPVQSWTQMRCHSGGSEELARHVLECHRQLAQVEGPGQQAFASIARHLEGELQSPPPAPEGSGVAEP